MECIWCHEQVTYAFPPQEGHPDAYADLPHLYRQHRHQGWHDMTLVTSTGSPYCTGAGALTEAGVAIGQSPAHEVTP